MASPRRANHGHQPSLVSDYESDGHYLSDLPGPPPIPRTNEELNLSVVRRYRPDTISIEYTAPYVVVYGFGKDPAGWEKSGIEGSTFICALSPNAEYDYRCAVVVLSRRGLENLNIELVNSEAVEYTERLIIIQDQSAEKPQVYGLWVFRDPPPASTAHHPIEFAEKLKMFVEKAESSKRKPVPQQNGHQTQEQSVPMGRQISLRELFGQQRQEDDSWSVRSHSPSRRTSNAAPVPPLMPELVQASTPQFQATADTDFFRSVHQKPSNPVSPLPQASAQPSGQQQTLLDLFRKASEQRT